MSMAGSEHSRFKNIPGVPSWLLSFGINVALVLVVAGGVVGLLYVIRLAATITVPLILAVVIAIIAHPLINLGKRIKFPRPLSAVIVIILVLGLGAAAIQITATGVINQASNIKREMVSGVNDLGEYAVERLGDLGIPRTDVTHYFSQATQAITNYTSGLFSGAGSKTESSGSSTESNLDIGSLSAGLTSGINQVKSVLSGVFGALFMFFLGILCLYYLLTDYDNIMGFIGRHLGVNDKIGAGLVKDAARSMRGYFKSTTITAVVVAAVIGIALAVMGVPLVLPIVIVTFLTAYIPFFGALISGAFACLIALGHSGIQGALIILIVVIVAQNVIQSVVNNFAISKSLDLHPLASLIVTILGNTFCGILGAMLAAPILSMGLAAYKRLQVARSGEEEGKDPDEIRAMLAGLQPERKQIKIIRRRPHTE